MESGRSPLQCLGRSLQQPITYRFDCNASELQDSGWRVSPFAVPEIYTEPYTNCGRFRELCRIGEGAFGDVLIGIDQHAGRFVAIKNVRLMNPGRGKSK